MTKHCTRWNSVWQTCSIIVNEDSVSTTALVVLSLESTYILVVAFSLKEGDTAPSLPSLLIATGRRDCKDLDNSVSMITPNTTNSQSGPICISLGHSSIHGRLLSHFDFLVCD